MMRSLDDQTQKELRPQMALQVASVTAGTLSLTLTWQKQIVEELLFSVVRITYGDPSHK